MDQASASTRHSHRASASVAPTQKIANELHIPPYNPNKRPQQQPATHPNPQHQSSSSNRPRPTTAAVILHHDNGQHASHSLHSDNLSVPQQTSGRYRSSHQAQSSVTVPNTPNESGPSALNMVGPSHPMPRQRVYFGPYLLLQTLGEGEFGKVKLGVHSSPDRWGEEVAIKLIKRGNVDTQARMIKVAREIDVLKLVKHPNIVRLYDVIETEKYIGIVLEYASGGELFDHILAHRYLKEKDASKLFAQLISGVTYLHNKKIVHRDLKLENLLLDRNRNIIITDFGFANRFEDRSNDLMATSCGSPCYAAPELVVQDGRYVGSQVDVWSCGVILYAMLAGYLPFDDDPSNPDGDNINLLYKYIINTPLSFPEWVSDEPKDLLLRMLVPDPMKRCSLKDVINHPWLAKYQHLFHRSLEELERISDENEQAKRIMLQRQRQLIAAGHASSSRPTQAGDINRSMSSANNSHGAANKSRGHQSAVVVPSNSISVDEPSPSHPSAGAYHQQQRHPSGGTVTHLHSTTHPPTGIPVPTNRRNNQAQSAIVVPTASHGASDRDPPLVSADSGLYASYAPLNNVKEKVMLDDDGKASTSTASSGKKRKVGGPAAPSIYPETSPSHPPLPQQRHTVQVEYSDGSGREDVKGKGKVERRPSSVVDDDMTDLTTGPRASMDHDDPTLTPTSLPSTAMPVTPTNPVADPQIRTTPQPRRSRQSIVPISPSLSSDRPHRTSSRKGLPSNGLDDSKISFPSPANTTAQPTSGSENLVAAPKVNNSQVSFGTASQASGHANVGPKADAAKAEARHRKGLSTDRFLARFLGGHGTASAINVSDLTAPSTPPHSTKKPPSYSAAPPPTSSKTARRKALSMVVEPLGGKLSSAASARANRKSAKIITSSTNVPPTPPSEEAKRRVRGTSVMAASAQSISSPVLPNSPEMPPMPPKRRITLTASHRRPNEAHASHSPIVQPTPHLVVSGQAVSRPVEPPRPGGPSEEEDKRRRELQTASPNWSHHTAATTSGNSTGQASNSSKAKRVMDWFRFKSLNHSNTSAHQAQLPILNDQLIPPTPIRTDFDSKRRVNQAHHQAAGHLAVESTSASAVSTLEPAQNGQVAAQSHSSPANGVSTTMQPQQSAQSGASTKASHRFTLAHPKLNPESSAAPTLGTAAPTAASPSPAHPQFNDAKLKLHHGAIDQNAISSKPPPLIMRQLRQILWELGIDVIEENPMKLKATRRSKKKVVASLGMGVFEALQQQQQQLQNQSSGQAGSAFRSLFQRKASAGSHGSGQIGILIDQFGQVTTNTAGGSEASESAVTKYGPGNNVQPLPAYADDPSIDSGDDVRFTVEITRLRGLVGLYAVDIKRLKGSLWSFKYLYLQILERADLGKKP